MSSRQIKVKQAKEEINLQLYEKEDYIYNQIPIRIYNHSIEKEEIHTPLHWHRSIELDLALEGRIILKIDGKNQEMRKDDWNVVNSGELHSNTWVEREDLYKGITVLISKSFLDTWLGEDVYLAYPDNMMGQERIREVIKRLGEIKEKGGKFCKAKMMENLFLLVRLLGEYCIQENTENRGRRMKGINNIKSIINYIDVHYKENITLDIVAKEFHYSPAHLSRLFKEHIGYNFYEYLQDVRLMNAMELLKKSEDILFIDCAMETGFPNVKSFIATFKKIYNCTPSEWRKSKNREV